MGKKVLGSGTRNVDPAAHCFLIAKSYLKRAKEDERGSTSQLIVSLVFAAFALEGALNRIGKRLEPKRWDCLEPLRLKDKIDYLCLGILGTVEWGQRPLQSIQGLIAFRNLMAHAKEDNISITDADITSSDELDTNQNLNDRLRAKFEIYLDVRFADKAVKDVECLAKRLWEKGNCDRVPTDEYGDTDVDSGPFGSLGTSHTTIWENLDDNCE